jgi:hypothetical protein
MPDQLGEQLTELNRGDSVIVTVEDIQYDGEVIETQRWMCELNQGFMEPGAVSIEIKLSAETATRYELPWEYILVSATENAPQSWDEPQASVYEPTEDETTTGLGTVTGIKAGEDH